MFCRNCFVRLAPLRRATLDLEDDFDAEEDDICDDTDADTEKRPSFFERVGSILSEDLNPEEREERRKWHSERVRELREMQEQVDRESLADKQLIEEERQRKEKPGGLLDQFVDEDVWWSSFDEFEPAISGDFDVPHGPASSAQGDVHTLEATSFAGASEAFDSELSVVAKPQLTPPPDVTHLSTHPTGVMSSVERDAQEQKAQQSSGWLLAPVPITTSAMRMNQKRRGSFTAIAKEYKHQEHLAKIARANMRVERKKRQKLRRPHPNTLSKEDGNDTGQLGTQAMLVDGKRAVVKPVGSLSSDGGNITDDTTPTRRREDSDSEFGSEPMLTVGGGQHGSEDASPASGSCFSFGNDDAENEQTQCQVKTDAKAVSVTASSESTATERERHMGDEQVHEEFQSQGSTGQLELGNVIDYWSSWYVSSELECMLRLHALGYTAAYAGSVLQTPDDQCFLERETITYDEEEARCVKLAWGVAELVFNPIYLWRSHGILAPPMRLMTNSDRILLHDKLNFLSDACRHFALAVGPLVVWAQFFFWALWGCGALPTTNTCTLELSGCIVLSPSSHA